jgi:hypothetical protein
LALAGLHSLEVCFLHKTEIAFDEEMNIVIVPFADASQLHRTLHVQERLKRTDLRSQRFDLMATAPILSLTILRKIRHLQRSERLQMTLVIRSMSQ